MSVKVNESLSTINFRTGRIIVESSLTGAEAITELRSAAVRKEALQYAQSKGLSRPGVNSNVSVYPVDEDGNEIQSFDTTGTAKFVAEVSVSESRG